MCGKLRADKRKERDMYRTQQQDGSDEVMIVRVKSSHCFFNLVPDTLKEAQSQ